MPRVPTYQDNVPGVVESGRGFGGPQQNVRPQFDYESVMNRALQPINTLADTTVKIEAHFHDTTVKARADEELDAYSKEVQKLMYTPDTGYYAQRGKNAVESWDKTQQELQKIYDKRLSAIDDPDVKEAFKSVALQRMRSVREQSMQYRNSQNMKWRVDTSTAHLNNLNDEFAAAGFSPDSERTLASIENEVEYLGRLTGQGAEWVKMQKQAHVSLAFASAYANMAQFDSEAALDHFQKYGQKYMSTETARRTRDSLFKESVGKIWQNLQRMGGTVGLALTPGAVAQKSGVASTIAAAQRGIGMPPKVAETVLNTLGYKGCNPLNIRAGSDKWEGQIGVNDKGYINFSNPIDGIRAATKIIRNYGTKYGLNTIEEIVSRFAPATENPTDAYIENVCKTTGFLRNQKLDTKNPEILNKLISAMMKQEIGDVAYSQETINAGIAKGLGIAYDGLDKAQITKLTAADIAFNVNTKTGYDVYDNLTSEEKFKILTYGKQFSNQSLTSVRNELKQRITNALTVARAEGDTSKVPDMSEFTAVYGQDEGVRLHQETLRQAQVQSHVHNMSSMSDEELVNMSKAMTPNKDDPNYTQRISEKNDFDKAAIQIRKQRAEDPIAYALAAMPDLGLTQITDWSNIDAVCAEVAKRRDAAEQISEQFRTAPAIFSNQEIASFEKTMATLDADKQAAIVERLATQLHDPANLNNDALATLANQLTSKNGTFALAFGLASTDKGREENLAMHQIKGAFYYKQKTNDGYKDKNEVREALDNIFPFGEDDPRYSAAYEAVMNEHCFANQDGSQSVDKSVEKVFSKVVSYNEGKIFEPSKMSKLGFFDNDFDDFVEQAGKELAESGKTLMVGGQAIKGEQLSTLLSNAQLQWIADGVYLIKDGLRYVTDQKGNPYQLDLNPYVEKELNK